MYYGMGGGGGCVTFHMLQKGNRPEDVESVQWLLSSEHTNTGIKKKNSQSGIMNL